MEKQIGVLVQEIYYLILLKQYGKATREDLDLLRFDIIEFLKISERKFHEYLKCHKVKTFDEYYSEVINNFINNLIKLVEETHEIPLDIPVIDKDTGAKVELEEIFKFGIHKLYEEYLNTFNHSYVITNIVKQYERIKEILENDNEYTLSELILEFDRIIDTIHISGRFVQAYMGFNPERCKALAERRFRNHFR